MKTKSVKMPSRAEALALAEGYSIERIFERIAVTLDGGLPSGDRWHRLLLAQMAGPQAGIRPAFIDDKLSQRVEEYMKFRHRFRYTYGGDLLWEKLQPLAEGVEEVFRQLRAQLAQFNQQIS
ncbi:MAG: hypothetical protein O7E52_27110 [Candidatus Poribacteria bacterium]|nr:hypothetical protein [Candidatus Poribacteria bacterium]